MKPKSDFFFFSKTENKNKKKIALAVALLRAHERDVTEEMLSIVAMSTVPNVLPEGSRGTTETTSFSVQEGDHLTQLNIFTAFSASRVPRKWAARHRMHGGYLVIFFFLHFFFYLLIFFFENKNKNNRCALLRFVHN